LLNYIIIYGVPRLFRTERLVIFGATMLMGVMITPGNC